MNKFAVTKTAAKALDSGLYLRARDTNGRFMSTHETRKDAELADGTARRQERAVRASVVLNNLEKFNPAYRADLLSTDINDPKATTITHVMQSEEEFIRLLKQ